MVSRRTLKEACAVGVVAAFATQPIADAHTVYEVPTVHNSDGGRNCVQARSEISHGSDYTQIRYATYSKEIVLGWDCARGKVRPPFDVMVTGKLSYRPRSGYTWGDCWTDPHWWGMPNDSSSVTVTERWNHRSRPCGNGDYAVLAYWGVKHKGTWYTWPPSVWSGIHYLKYEPPSGGVGGK